MTGWMRIALEEAEQAAREGEAPVGAVLVRGEELLSRDHNRREQRHDPTAHAEILCMRQGAEKLRDWRLSGCTLYVTLEPCPMCAGAMVMGRLHRCVFAAADEKQGCCGSVYDLPADPAFGCVTRWTHEPDDRAENLLKTFFSSRREKTLSP